MPLESNATQTTATNSATYLVNRRRRVFGAEISEPTPNAASALVAAGRCQAKPRLKKLPTLIPATLSGPSAIVSDRPVAVSCVDGPRLARENVTCRTEVACSHVSGLFTQSGWTAGPDGVREPRPHHSSGIDVPMKRQVSLGSVGSTDCAITRHCSLASSSPSAVSD